MVEIRKYIDDIYIELPLVCEICKQKIYDKEYHILYDSDLCKNIIVCEKCYKTLCKKGNIIKEEKGGK